MRQYDKRFFYSFLRLIGVIVTLVLKRQQAEMSSPQPVHSPLNSPDITHITSSQSLTGFTLTIYLSSLTHPKTHLFHKSREPTEHTYIPTKQLHQWRKKYEVLIANVICGRPTYWLVSISGTPGVFLAAAVWGGQRGGASHICIWGRQEFQMT